MYLVKKIFLYMLDIIACNNTKINSMICVIVGFFVYCCFQGSYIGYVFA